MDSPEVRYQSRIFRVVRESYLDHQGERHERDVILHPGAVTILPLLDDGRVCLIRNFRVATGETLIELPAGTLNVGEDPALAAIRELEEETGFRCGKLERLCAFYLSPGILSERMHLYVARELTPGPMALEAGEQIETHIVPWEEALELVREGKIQDAKTMVGLMFYDRFRRGAP